MTRFPSLLQDAVLLLAKAARERAQTKKMGVAARALLVGGCVRNGLLGKISYDADVEVHGIPVEELEEMLLRLFPGQVHLVGRAFGVFKISLSESRNESGRATLDVSLPRCDSKIGQGHKGFAVEGNPNLTLEVATRRRDFTINAMLEDPLTGELIDLFYGRQDLEQHVLRVVDPRTFQDDPLRVYRAVQFLARFELVAEKETASLLQQMVEREDFNDLTKERVTEEMRKLFLQAEHPSIGLIFAKQLGIIARSYPELSSLEETPQEPEWHPEGNAWIHTLMVLDEAAKLIRRDEVSLSELEKIQIIIGSLCHDLGKPLTTEKREGRVRSHGHEAAGKTPTQTLLSRWRFGDEVKYAALVATTEHLKPAMLYRSLKKRELTKKQYVNAVRKLLRRIHPVSWRVLALVAEADYRGRAIPGVMDDPYEIGQFFVEAVLSNELMQHVTKTLLQGRDLLAMGVAPGPRMGSIIRRVEQARDGGLVQTKEEALEFASRLLADF